jgi:hypothetical protein
VKALCHRQHSIFRRCISCSSRPCSAWRASIRRCRRVGRACFMRRVPWMMVRPFPTTRLTAASLACTAGLHLANPVRPLAFSVRLSVRARYTRDDAMPASISTRNSSVTTPSILTRERIPALSVQVLQKAQPEPVAPEPVPILHSSAYLRTSYSSLDEGGSATTVGGF